jgi:hypothetical protein
LEFESWGWIASQTGRCCEARDFLHVLHFYTANNQNKNAEATIAEGLARGYGAEPHFKNTFTG